MSAWGITVEAYGHVLGLLEGIAGITGQLPQSFADIVSAWEYAGQAYGNLVGAIGEVFGSLPDMLATAVDNGITKALTGSQQQAIPGFESGTDAVPKTGLYMLHKGEGVLTAEENRAMQQGVLGSYAGGTGMPWLPGYVPFLGKPMTFPTVKPSWGATFQGLLGRNTPIREFSFLHFDPGQTASQMLRWLETGDQRIKTIPAILQSQIYTGSAGQAPTYVKILMDLQSQMMSGKKMDFGPMVALMESHGLKWDAEVFAKLANKMNEIQATQSIMSYFQSFGTYDANRFLARSIARKKAKSAEEGAWNTSESLYHLHQGEMILPAPLAEAVRTGQGGGSLTITLQIGDIYLARGGKQEAEEFITAVEGSIKSGRLRQAVQRATTGQV
jgi:hypothetical protein